MGTRDADGGQSGPVRESHPSAPIRVLFLCTGNSARSQIAEALLVKKGGSRFIVGSAGARPAPSVHPKALAALRQANIDWSNRHPKGFEAVQGENWDLVITLCDRTKEACPALPGRPVYAHWGVPDPAAVDPAGPVNPFEATVQLLSWRIDLMLALPAQQLDRAVAEERLRGIGSAYPDGPRPPA